MIEISLWHKAIDPCEGSSHPAGNNELKMGAILIFGFAGAVISTISALIFGYGLVGLVVAYVAGGVVAVIGAAMIAYLADRPKGHDHDTISRAPTQKPDSNYPG